MILNSYSSTSVYMHLQFLLYRTVGRYRRYLNKARASLSRALWSPLEELKVGLEVDLRVYTRKRRHAPTAARALAKLRRPTPDGPVHQGADGAVSLTGRL